MKRTSSITLLACMFFIAGFLFISCQKDSDNVPGGIETGSTVKTTISGVVVDSLNNPISGATVIFNNKTYHTGHGGIFYITNVTVSKKRVFVEVQHNSYMNMFKAAVPTPGGVTYLKVVLYKYKINLSFPSSTGATYLNSGIKIVLPANGYVTSAGNTYTGMVVAKARYLNPAENSFSNKIPGGDMMAVNAANQSRILYSYGMLEVSLFASNSNEPLNLAPGHTASLTFPVDPSQQATAPMTIPTWYFDENIGLWKEEGEAIRNGNSYEFTVTHFTWWNCDTPAMTAYIKGKVVDCNGTPMANVVVTINNSYNVITDNLGNYYSQVGVNVSFPVQVLASNNSAIFSNSQIETVPMLSSQQIFTLPDLIIPCTAAKITGTITNCGGLPGAGILLATWNGGQNYIGCINGSYIFNVPASTAITLKYFTSLSTINSVVSSGAASSVTDVGNTILCENIPVSNENSFILDGGGYSNQLFTIDTIYASGYYPNGFAVQILGVNLPTNQSVSIYVFLPDTIPQTFPIDTSYLGSFVWLTVGQIGYQSHWAPSTMPIGIVTLQEWRPRVKGVFNCTLQKNDGTIIQLTNGKFNASNQYN